LSCNSKVNDLNETIIRLVKEKKPQSVNELITILKGSFDLDEKVILDHVLKLQAEGLLNLENQPSQSRIATTYLKTGEALWYWVTIAAGAITVALVLTISQNVYPWAYVRNVFGVIFVLFLPGYAFIKALFPFNTLATETSTKELETISRVGLSIGTSIALVSIVGLFLYYSPWGLDLTAIVLSIFGLTVVFATVAVSRNSLVKIEA
jgi:hypothetical protein